MYYTTKDTRKIYYEIIGNTTSTKCIVFLNGLSQSTLAWGLMTPYFIEKYKIILLDLLFQGQSDKEGDYKNFDEHAADVVGLMQELNIPKAHICGLSYGSLVAQHLAVNYPLAIDKLILISTFAHKTEYYKAVELSWKRAIEMGGYNMLLDVMLPFVLAENYFENPIIPLDILKQSRKGLNDNSEALIKLMRATAERKDYLEELKQITSPTLIIHGRFDKLFPVSLAEAVQHSIKNSKLKVVETSGHTLNLEAAKNTSEIILEFLG